MGEGKGVKGGIKGSKELSGEETCVQVSVIEK
jgi:hypothetical protein